MVVVITRCHFPLPAPWGRIGTSAAAECGSALLRPVCDEVGGWG